MAKHLRPSNELNQSDIDAEVLHFVIKPPFGPEDWNPKAPPHLHAATRWAMSEVGLTDAKHQVEFAIPGSDLAPTKRDELRRRIRLVLELAAGTRNRRPTDRLVIDLMPPKPQNRKRTASAARLDSTAFDELTQRGNPGQPRPMRAGRGSKKQSSSGQDGTAQSTSRSDDPVAELNELAAPKLKTEEMLKLERILMHAKLKGVSNKDGWVDSMIAALEAHGLAIKIESGEGTGDICRRFYIDRNGVIGLQNTDGDKRGFKEIDFSLVSYVRPYAKGGKNT